MNTSPDLYAKIAPRYDGGSILNLVSSLAQHFGVSTGAARLEPALEAKLGLAGAESVVLVVVDALGDWQLEKHIADGDTPNLKAMLGHANRDRLTSVFPSTTMAALTAMHTGVPPAVSGWLGYTLWLEEVGSVVEMIDQIDLVRNAKLERPEFLKAVPSLYSKLDPAGVNCHGVQPSEYRGSFLNDWYFQGATQHGYVSPSTLPTTTHRALRTSSPEYVVAYWPKYDSVCHRHGPSSMEASDEASAFDHALGRLLRLLPRDGKTLLVITADHGQKDLEADRTVYLEDDAKLRDLLDGPPAGDRVCRTFRAKPGALDPLRARLEAYGEVIASSESWDSGLYGGPPARASFRARVGDFTVLTEWGVQLCWSFGRRAAPHLGSHGGLTAAEMIVPMIALRV